MYSTMCIYTFDTDVDILIYTVILDVEYSWISCHTVSNIEFQCGDAKVRFFLVLHCSSRSGITCWKRLHFMSDDYRLWWTSIGLLEWLSAVSGFTTFKPCCAFATFGCAHCHVSDRDCLVLDCLVNEYYCICQIDTSFVAWHAKEFEF